jgi:hypothetical protein
VLSPVAKKISYYAPGGYNAFAGGYQKQALTYIQSLSFANSLSAAKAVQYYALACLFYATNGVSNPATKALIGNGAPPGWRINTNWLSKTVDPCSGKWHGVTCSSNRVTELSLNSTGLTGSMPFEITLLSSNNPSKAGNLIYMDLFTNPYLFNDGDVGELDWIGGLGSNMRK